METRFRVDNANLSYAPNRVVTPAGPVPWGWRWRCNGINDLRTNIGWDGKGLSALLANHCDCAREARMKEEVFFAVDAIMIVAKDISVCNKCFLNLPMLPLGNPSLIF